MSLLTQTQESLKHIAVSSPEEKLKKHLKIMVARYSEAANDLASRGFAREAEECKTLAELAAAIYDAPDHLLILPTSEPTSRRMKSLGLRASRMGANVFFWLDEDWCDPLPITLR